MLHIFTLIASFIPMLIYRLSILLPQFINDSEMLLSALVMLGKVAMVTESVVPTLASSLKLEMSPSLVTRCLWGVSCQ